MRVVVAVCAFVACVHAGIWALTQRQVDAPNFSGQLASVSYTPFDGSAHPDSGTTTTPQQIRSDLATISGYTRTVRTYSSTGGSELVPLIANEFGMRTSVGAWVDRDNVRNEREIRSVIDLARRHRNITSVVVGNETIYRADQTVEELIRKIQHVKRETGLPVTTGEIWHAWLDHPELVSAVDYIAAHVLPYWEGIPDVGAVDQAIRVYNRLRAAYPGKRIVIAEFGWPSAGHNRRDAVPSRTSQAQVLREFVTRAEQLGIDYNIIEAYDQPWKTFEGGVGPYWGFLDTGRQPKFFWTGPIGDPNHSRLAIVALLIGVLLSLPLLAMSAVTVGQAATLSIAAHAVGAWFAYVFGFWNGHYFVTGAAIAFGVAMLLLIPLVLIAMARVEEIAAVAFGRRPQRLVGAPSIVPDAPAGYAPKVSIHIPAYNEQPEMLKQTLDSVARLEYPNFECILVINNTPDPALWRPVEEHCKALGDRFKFVREDNLSGFKAGALRLALDRTAPDAEVIGILDADYVVQPDWLRDLAPLFADPRVGMVQAPQDHRDGQRSPMHTAMNAEYAGFFDIGMVQRNEANAIVTHGTMCLIRRDAMLAAGGWSSDTICEDTDLGLTILELGYLANYTNRRYGHGLLPDTYIAFKRQRHRWAYGGFQILKKHWRRFLPGASRLQRDQKREFALGWLNWLGAESLGVLVAILNLIWVPVVGVLAIAVPDKVLTIPILATFVVSVVHFVALYRLRVNVPVRQMIGSVFAAMSVQWTVARAVGSGLVKDAMPFVVTAKGGKAQRGEDFPAFWEAVLGGLLVAGAVFLYWTNWERVQEINLFALVLVVQSLPFLASAALATLEASRANDYAAWRALDARLAPLMPWRVAPAPLAPALADAHAAVEPRAEPAQAQ
jgi:exo-beta-1,3-glucanase (GH17 family)/cellulose synthase/poly-beta-1,6-N-acetylglucosamine synthase-like glycosyltransferase